LKSFPALTQSNLEYELQEEPYFKPTYQEIDTTHISNYKNYVFQAQSSKHWKNAEFNGFNLPAQGEYKPYCMKWVSWGCDNVREHPNKKHYAEHEVKTCKVANCPKCFESWINRQANRTTRRLTKYTENKKYNFKHIILSPPTEAKNQSYNSLKNWLNFALKKANIKTACVVFHPFRFQDNKKSMPYVSPHFHLLVYDYTTNITEFYNKTKWIIKNKGQLGSEIDVFNCTRYLLSHSGIRKKTHTVRYLGDISYRKLKIEKEPFKHNCPYCELPLRIFKIKFDQKTKPPPIDLVGLWDSNCFEPIDGFSYKYRTNKKGKRVKEWIIDPEAQIPFYEMNEDPKSDSDYTENLHYSFEESLKISMAIPAISDRYYELSNMKNVTARKCQTLENFLEFSNFRALSQTKLRA